MKILFLTGIILTSAVVQGEQTAEDVVQMAEPCQNPAGNNQYNTFVHRHILRQNFNRKNRKDWENFLVKKGLCDRVKGQVQSFIDAKESQIQQICSPAGRRVQGATGSEGNRCISTSPMNVYDVSSRKQGRKCNVTKIKKRRSPVVVSCDKVGNDCRPVHYVRYINQRGSNRPCV